MPVNNWADYLETWEKNYIEDIDKQISRMDAKRAALVQMRLKLIARGMDRGDRKRASQSGVTSGEEDHRSVGLTSGIHGGERGSMRLPGRV